MGKKIAKIVVLVLVIVLAITGAVSLVQKGVWYINALNNTIGLLRRQVDLLAAYVELHDNYLKKDRDYQRYLDKVKEAHQVKK